MYILGDRLWRVVDWTGWGSCPAANFGVTDVKYLGYTTQEPVMFKTVWQGSKEVNLEELKYVNM